MPFRKRWIAEIVGRVMIFLIRIYQGLASPFIAGCCRFYPSCSEYACQSISMHGALKGGLKAMLRISRCHPFHPGGYDPPDANRSTKVN